ncbi:NlpC/P60 family protein [Paenibacillus qinlingensis]|uniref:Cell wall-associated NlpC family hydrolase n=1 Tax=Paenibacillus qinlingensis TaxID=1837343 RepID=A0ABU1NZP7_9BACL|nr:NlpC/P60 family protein [Paenibacillus qinlingensis]MDR6552975.1 cell wall-associated NlpC family hydrolase [Paenibacillus qinlingensis]
MWSKLKTPAIGSMVVMLAISTAACGKDTGRPQIVSPSQSPSVTGTGNSITKSLSQAGNNVIGLASNDAILPMKQIGSVNYVSAQDLIKTLNFQSEWEDNQGRLIIGDNDANFELIMNSNKAVKDGTDIQLSQPVVKEGTTAYLPVSDLADLFQDDMSYEVKTNEVVIHASPIAIIEHEDDPASANDNSPELNFGDDPTDPFKGDEAEANPAWIPNQTNADLQVLQAWSASNPGEVMPVLKNIDINALINKGKNYLGVKYKFGTGSYPKTGRFDCSTFTQYIFGKYNVRLPRVARQQGAKGNLISRKSLRKGDLMFFYVPGRFKSNRTVGHVGIYIGNMKMLHASPEPKNGVQITNINKAYWKKTFLKAKRIAY